MKLTATQFVVGTVAFQDRKGNPAPVDGVPVITVSPLGVVDLAVNSETGEITLTALSVGEAVLQIEADADLGEGVVSILVNEPIEVTAAQAVAGQLNFGAPQEQPE
jgi:hypothetical protein